MSARGWEQLVSVDAPGAAAATAPSLQGTTVIRISGCFINLKHPNELISVQCGQLMDKYSVISQPSLVTRFLAIPQSSCLRIALLPRQVLTCSWKFQEHMLKNLVALYKF